MPSQSINITLSMDDSGALSVWQRQQKEIGKTGDALNKLKLSKDPTDILQSGLSEAYKTLTKFAVTFTGIGSAAAGLMAIARQIKAEYEALKSRQAGANATQIEYAAEISAAVRQAGLNIKGPEMEQLVLKGSTQTGQAPITVARAYNAAFTAKAPRTEQEAKQRIEEANAVLEQYPEQDQETKAQLTAVTAQNKEAFGLTTQQAVGYQQQAQNVSFVKNVTSFAQNVAGKLSAIAKSGDANAAEAAALAGSLSQAGGDFEGATSTLAALTFGAELKERLPNLKTFDERLAFMQQDYEKNTKKYIEGGEFNGKKHNPAETGRSIHKAHIIDLLNPNSKLAKEYKDNLKSYGDAKQWEETAGSVRREVKAIPSVQLATARNASEAARQQLQLDDTEGAAAASARDALVENLKAAGETDLAQKIAMARFEINAGIGSSETPFTEVANQLGEKADQLVAPRKVQVGTDTEWSTSETIEVPQEPAELERNTMKAKRLRELQQNLIRIDRDLRQANTSKRAEAAYTETADAVSAYESSTTKTPEMLAAVRAKYDLNYRSVKDAEKDERGTGQTAGRERLDKYKALEERLKQKPAEVTPDQVKPREMTPTERARESQRVTQQQIDKAIADGVVSAEESRTISDSLSNAETSTKSAVQGFEKTGGNAEEMAALKANLQMLIEAVKTLAADMKQNSEATAANTKAATAKTTAPQPTPRAVPLSTANDIRNRGG